MTAPINFSFKQSCCLCWFRLTLHPQNPNYANNLAQSSRPFPTSTCVAVAQMSNLRSRIQKPSKPCLSFHLNASNKSALPIPTNANPSILQGAQNVFSYRLFGLVKRHHKSMKMWTSVKNIQNPFGCFLERFFRSRSVGPKCSKDLNFCGCSRLSSN
jgi:hypothetical protein